MFLCARSNQFRIYGDGNGQVFFTFDWLDFRMEFETTIGQNSLFFVCFETGYHPKFSVFVWRAKTASPSIRDGPVHMVPQAPTHRPPSLVLFDMWLGEGLSRPLAPHV